MATPRNMTEVILLDRGFSKVNEKVFKKIFLPIMSEGEGSSLHCSIDIDDGDNEPERVKNGFVFSFIKKLYNGFGKSSYLPLRDDHEEKQDLLYLRVESLPTFIKKNVFACKKVDVENWMSLKEGLMSAARLKVGEVKAEWRQARETLELLHILRTIRNSCMTRDELFEALGFVN